jgi:hypothetical protein
MDAARLENDLLGLNMDDGDQSDGEDPYASPVDEAGMGGIAMQQRNSLIDVDDDDDDDDVECQQSDIQGASANLIDFDDAPANHTASLIDFDGDDSLEANMIRSEAPNQIRRTGLIFDDDENLLDL